MTPLCVVGVCINDAITYSWRVYKWRRLTVFTLCCRATSRSPASVTKLNLKSEADSADSTDTATADTSHDMVGASHCIGPWSLSTNPQPPSRDKTAEHRCSVTVSNHRKRRWLWRHNVVCFVTLRYFLKLDIRVEHKNFGPLAKPEKCHKFSLPWMTFQLAWLNNFTFHIKLYEKPTRDRRQVNVFLTCINSTCFGHVTSVMLNPGHHNQFGENQKKTLQIRPSIYVVLKKYTLLFMFKLKKENRGNAMIP